LVNRILGLNGHLGITSIYGNGISDFDSLTAAVAENPNILAAVPQIESQGLVPTNKNTFGGIVRGGIWSD